jgi:hypothetical protein
MSDAVCNSCDAHQSLHHCIVPPSLADTHLPTTDVCHCCIDYCYVDLLSPSHDIPVRSGSRGLGFYAAEKEMSQHIGFLLRRGIDQYLDRPYSLHGTTAIVLETRNFTERAHYPVHAVRHRRVVSDISFDPGMFRQR